MEANGLPAGMIAAIASSDTGRYRKFFENLNGLELPEGTVKSFATGERRNVLNELAEALLASDAYWIWFISDAHGFGPGIVNGLLRRDEPVIAPISVSISAPFLPNVWSDVNEEEVTPFKLNQVIGPSSIISVRGASVDGMLVRRAVFESIDPPWFRASEHHSEDVYFCEAARASGFEVMIDSTSRLSTLALGSVNPTHNGHSWSIDVTVGEDLSFTQLIKQR